MRIIGEQLGDNEEFMRDDSENKDLLQSTIIFHARLILFTHTHVHTCARFS